MEKRNPLIKLNSSAGFSILECLIALAILSIALSWISNLFLQQRLSSLKNESITTSVKIAQTILDSIRQRKVSKTPYENYVLKSGAYTQICDKNTAAINDPNEICPVSGISTERAADLQQVFRDYYKAIITFCPYDLDATVSVEKKCTSDSRYIKVEIVDNRRDGADADKYVTETAFTKFGREE